MTYTLTREYISLTSPRYFALVCCKFLVYIVFHSWYQLTVKQPCLQLSKCPFLSKFKLEILLILKISSFLKWLMAGVAGISVYNDLYLQNLQLHQVWCIFQTASYTNLRHQLLGCAYIQLHVNRRCVPWMKKKMFMNHLQLQSLHFMYLLLFQFHCYKDWFQKIKNVFHHNQKSWWLILLQNWLSKQYIQFSFGGWMEQKFVVINKSYRCTSALNFFASAS